LALTIEGRMEGKRPKGRPRIIMNIIMKRRALDRESWRAWVQGPAMWQRTDDDNDDDDDDE